jgi:hypothetical protein
VRKDKLESSVVDSGEVARARRLVLLGAESERVAVNATVGVAGMVLVGLDKVEVRTLTLSETVLAVKLELSGYDRVDTPAVHVMGSLSEYESTSIRDSRLGTTSNERGVHARGHTQRIMSVGTTVGADPLSVNKVACSRVTKHVSAHEFANSIRATEGMYSVRKYIHGISVVERLGTHELVEVVATTEGSAVIYMSIRLDNPQELLAGVVEVELNLVRRRTNGLITGELELLNEVLVGVLGHASALISVKENIVDIEGSSDEGLVVGTIPRLLITGGCIHLIYGP